MNSGPQWVCLLILFLACGNSAQDNPPIIGINPAPLQPESDLEADPTGALSNDFLDTAIRETHWAPQTNALQTAEPRRNEATHPNASGLQSESASRLRTSNSEISGLHRVLSNSLPPIPATQLPTIASGRSAEGSSTDAPLAPRQIETARPPAPTDLSQPLPMRWEWIFVIALAAAATVVAANGLVVRSASARLACAFEQQVQARLQSLQSEIRALKETAGGTVLEAAGPSCQTTSASFPVTEATGPQTSDELRLEAEVNAVLLLLRKPWLQGEPGIAATMLRDLGTEAYAHWERSGRTPEESRREAESLAKRVRPELGFHLSIEVVAPRFRPNPETMDYPPGFGCIRRVAGWCIRVDGKALYKAAVELDHDGD